MFREIHSSQTKFQGAPPFNHLSTLVGLKTLLSEDICVLLSITELLPVIANFPKQTLNELLTVNSVFVEPFKRTFRVQTSAFGGCKPCGLFDWHGLRLKKHCLSIHVQLHFIARLMR